MDMTTVIDKVVYPGKINHRRMFVRISFNTDKQRKMNTHIRPEGDAGELSMCGVIGPRANGDADSCGQCSGSLLALDSLNKKEGWSITKVRKLYMIWQKYHLNFMNAGCEHQDKELDLDKKVTIYKYISTDKADKLEDDILDGKCDNYCAYTCATNVLKAINYFLYEKPWRGSPVLCPVAMKALLDGEFIKVKETEEKLAHWTNHEENPEGYLGLKCRICGWEYGNGWSSREIPADVIEWLVNLPATEEPYAWA